ncbi:hypothetical protein Y032_0053g2413 [Ancylostoma ceylanicum]|uniref:Peptidase M12A domain-containing protein n=1 Tax=Ancylostoma ceylanicum TaxID=53326 RepID=A0A016U750_9BILA|nr:hypothetical protein Y032_0053g2413 [Ancylostoma ceylanicum]
MGATTHFFILLLCLHAAFFTVTTGRRAPSVDIQNQKGGDLRGGRRGAGRGYNSYRLQFPLEHIWDLYQDEDGKFVIPYEFENRSSYGPEALFNITCSMDQYDRNTCVRFRPRRDEWNYMYIKNENDG